MTGKKTFYYLLIAVSVLFILFSLLFLIAAVNNPARMNIAAASGFIGAALMYFSLAAIANINYNSPANLEPLILKIAKRNNGYFSAEEVMARLNITEKSFNAVVDSMISRGAALEESRDGSLVYKAAAVSLEVKRKCEFCGNEFNVRDALEKCPGCGGSVKTG
jgi:Zn finger protein HypA/HybF involved in hydrogenase expression